MTRSQIAMALGLAVADDEKRRSAQVRRHPGRHFCGAQPASFEVSTGTPAFDLLCKLLYQIAVWWTRFGLR
jgi:hypothetical protein